MRFINQYLTRHFHRRIFAKWLIAAAIPSLFSPGTGWGETIDILRAVPLEVSGDASAQQFPARFQTADEVLRALDGTPVLLVHMEAIRRSYADLSVTERDKVHQ